STVQKLLGGLGNMDDNVIELPSGTYRARTIRTYDPAKQTWTIWWIDSRNPGHLDPPVVGRFEKEVGTFYADDQFKGKAIRVRYLWNASTAPHWEQASVRPLNSSWSKNSPRPSLNLPIIGLLITPSLLFAQFRLHW